MTPDALSVRGAIPRPAPDAITIRCPAISTAREIRTRWGPFCHLDEQDRRYRTVWLEADTPMFIVDQVRHIVENDTDRTPRYGQLPLSDHERNRLQVREDWTFGTKGFHARACKAIADYYEVHDWTAHYDHTLIVDEHEDVYQSVTGESQTMRELDRGRLGLGGDD